MWFGSQGLVFSLYNRYIMILPRNAKTYAICLGPGPRSGPPGPSNWYRLPPPPPFSRHWMYAVTTVLFYFCSYGSFPRHVRCRNVSRILNPQERYGVIYRRAFCSNSPRTPRTVIMPVLSPECRLARTVVIGVCGLMRSYFMRRPSAVTSELKTLQCSTVGCL
jgi:hypothetical protein